MGEGGSGIWTPGGTQPPRRPEPEEPTPEQLIEQIRQLKVSDLVLSTMSTLAQLAYVKLEPSSRDLEQARLAIESLRVLVPVLGGAVPPELVRDFNQVVANLQLAYADAAVDPDPAEGSQPGPTAS